MLKNIFNMKKCIFGILAITAVATGIGVYQNMKSNNKEMSFEKEMLTAAKKYVEANKVSIENQIRTTASMLTKIADFNADEANEQCVENSYVLIKNVDGEYVYEPVVVCESSETIEKMHDAIGFNTKDAMTASSPATLLITNLGNFYSDTKPTRNNITVTITTNYAARIISESTGWTVSSDGKTFTKLYEENGSETIVLKSDEAIIERTVQISVNNIDRTAPTVTGVKDGETYLENKKVTFDEGTATLDGEDFTSGSTVKEGVHQLVVTDEAGNTTTINFTIDTTAPVITFIDKETTNEIKKAYHNDNVDIKITDVSTYTATYTFNGEEKGTFDNTVYFYDAGTYTVTATDKVGRTSTKTITLDFVAPKVSVKTNTDTVLNHQDHTKTDRVILSVEDSAPITGTYSSDTGLSGTFTTKSISFTAVGKYKVEVKDEAGNVADSFEFVIDRQAPTIKGITDNGYYGKNNEAKIEFEDDYSNQTQLTATLKDQDGNTKTITNGYVETNDGTYTLTVVDKAGNSVKRTFQVSKADVSMVSATYNTNWTNNDITVTVTFNKPVKITSANASRFHKTGTETYNTTYTVTVSKNETVEFSFMDQYGNANTDSFEIKNIDKTAPTFNGGVSNPATLTRGPVTVTLNFSELVQVTATVNGKNITLNPVAATEGYATSYTTTMNENGVIVMSFIDRAGNSGTATYEVKNMDTVFPILQLISNGQTSTIQGEADKDYYFRGNVRIRYSDNNTSRENLVVGYYDIGANIVPVVNNSVLSTEGKYHFIVRDQAGNETEVYFTIDSTAPSIELTSVSNPITIENTIYYSKPVDVSISDITTSNPDNVFTTTISLNGSIVTVGDGETRVVQTGNGTYTLNASGNYVITATDEAGNISTKRITIDKDAPVVTLSPEKEANAIDNKIYYNSAVTLNITDQTKTTIIANGTEVLSNVFRDNGTYTVVVKDIVGNETTVEFIIAQAKPSIELSSSDGTTLIEGNTIDGITYYRYPVTISSNSTIGYTVEVKDENGNVVTTTNNVVTNPGTYTAKVVDYAGNSSNTVKFIIDDVKPTVTGVENGEHYKTDVTITVDDVHSPVIATLTDSKGNKITFTESKVVSEEGEYILTATDAAGNALIHDIEFVIDKTAPTITGVENDTYYGKKDTVTFDYSDLYTKNEADLVVILKKDNKEISVPADKTLTESGTYTLSVTDKALNNKTIQFTVDKRDITVSKEPNIETTTSSNVIVTLTFNKPVKVTSDEAKFVPVQADQNGYTDTYTVEIEANGIYHFTATDRANNTLEDTVEIKNIDKTAPTFDHENSFHTPNTLTNLENVEGNAVTVTLKFSEKVTILSGTGNDSEFVPEAGSDGKTWTTTVTSSKTITFKFKDDAGFEVTDSYTVSNIDLEKPTAVIKDKETGAVIGTVTGKEEKVPVFSSKKAVTVEFTDDRASEVVPTASYGTGLNATPITSGESLNPGVIYTITVVDGANNKTTFTVIVDEEPPAVDIMNVPAEGTESTTAQGNTYTETINGKEVEVTYYKNPVTIRVTDLLDPNPTVTVIKENDSEFTYTDGMALGNGTYIVTATDHASNTTTKTIVVDGETPAVRDYEFEPDATDVGFTNKSVTVTIYFKKPVKVTTSSYVNEAGETKNITLSPATKDAVYDSVYTLTMPENGTFTFTFEDKAGNSNTVSNSVDYIDTEAPSIHVTTPEDGTIKGITEEIKDENNQVIERVTYYQDSVKVSYNDNSRFITAIKITKNGTVFVNKTVTSEVSNLISETDTLTEEGRYVVEITDKAGNKKLQTIVIDKQDPTIHVVSEENAPLVGKDVTEGDITTTYYNEKIKLNITDNSQNFLPNAHIKTTYSVNGGEEIAYTGQTLEINGTYQVTSTDQSGRKKTITFELDTTAPKFIEPDDEEAEIKSSHTPNTLTNLETIDAVTVTLVFSEPVKITGITDENNATKDFAVSNNYSTSHTVKMVKSATIQFTFEDKAGTSRSASYTVSNIDLVKPTAVIKDGETVIGTVTGTEQTIPVFSSKKAVTVEFTDDRASEVVPTASYGTGLNATTIISGETLNPGTIYTITVVDGANNKTTFTVIVDAVPPVIDAMIDTEVAPGNTYTETINGKEVEVTYYKNPVTIQVTDLLDPNPTVTVTKENDSEFTYTDGMTLGNGTYTVTATDHASNTATKTIVVDDGTEEISVDYTFEPSKTVVGTTKEAVKVTISFGKPVKVTTSSYVNEAGETKNITLSPATKDAVYDSVYTLTMTENGTFTFTFEDKAGNSYTKNNSVDYIDTEAPKFTLLPIDSDSLLGNLIVLEKDDEGQATKTIMYYRSNVRVAYSDNNGTENIDHITITKDGKEYTRVDSSVFSDDFTTDGLYVITVTDKAGNKAEISFVIDKTPAELIVKDKDGKVVTPISITENEVTTIYYNVPVQITAVDSRTTDSSKFVVNEPYALGTLISANGSHTIVVKDEAGNESPITFVIDTKAPEIIVTPEEGTTSKEVNGIIYYNGSVKITATDTRENSVLTATLDGNGYTLGDSYGTNGYHTVTVKDDTNNSATVHFVIDTEAPEITDGTTKLVNKYYDHYFTVTVKDNSELFENIKTPVIKASIKRNEEAAVEFTKTYEITQDGTYTVTVEDETGNHDSITFNVDKTKPEFDKVNTTQTPSVETNLTKDGENAVIVYLTFNEKVKPVTATFTDLSGKTTTVSLEKVNEEEYSTQYRYSTTENGTISFTFEDQAGNTNSASYDVTNIDKEAPTIILKNEKDEIATIKKSIEVKDEEGNLIRTIHYYAENVYVSVTDMKNGVVNSIQNVSAELNGTAYTLESKTLTTEDGYYIATALDGAGNTKTEYFVVDTEAPEIEGLENGVTVGGTTYYNKNLNVTVTDNSLSFDESSKAGIEVTLKRPNAEVETVTDYRNISLTENGTYTITVKDYTHEAIVKTFVIDKQAPELIGPDDEEAEVKSSHTPNTLTNLKGEIDKVTVTLVFSEPVMIIGENAGNFVGSSEGYATSYTTTVTENQTITFKFKDVAGTEVTGSYVVSNIDKEEPEITITPEEGTTSKEVNGIIYYNGSVKITARDKKDGNYVEDTLRATIGNVEYTLGEIYSTNGYHTVRVSDTAGNVGVKHFVIDTAAPEITDGTTKLVNKYYDHYFTVTVKDNSELFENIKTPVIKASIKRNEEAAVEFTKTYEITQDGTYTVTVEDETGNRDSITFYVDTKAPTFIGATTNPEGLTNGDSIVVTLTFSEPVKVKEAGFDPVNVDQNGYATSYTTTVTENGSLSFSFDDRAGLSGSGSYQVKNFDRHAPVVTLSVGGKTQSFQGKDQKHQFFTKEAPITLTFTDENMDTVSVTLNDIAYIEATLTQDSENTLIAMDGAGNQTIVYITLDTKAPTMDLTSSATIYNYNNDNKYYSSESVTIDMSDEIDHNLAVSIVKDTEDITNRLEIDDSDNHKVVTITEPGTYTVTATDKAGWETTKIITIDGQTPVINTEKDVYSNQGTFTVSENVSSVTAEYTDLTGKKSTITLSPENGIYTLSSDGTYKITATDLAGNKGYKTIIIDSIAPVPSIKNDSYHNDKELSITITDLTKIKVTGTYTKFGTDEDGNAYEPESINTTVNPNGTYKATKEGTYHVVLEDEAGNKTTLNFVVDRTAPNIAGVVSGKHYNKNFVITFTDNSGMIQSAILKPDGSKTGFEIESGYEVTNTIQDGYELTVTDKAGNKQTIRFRIDTTAPVVTLVTGTGENQKSDIANNKEIRYYNVPVTITYDDKLQYQQVTATYSFASDKESVESFENKPLTNNTQVSEEGTYTVTVTDKAGNTDTIQFVVDITTPSIISPTNEGLYGKGVEIKFTEGTAKIDGEVVENGDIFAIEGTHTLVVVDQAGNKTTVNFTIDKSKPIIDGIPAKGISKNSLTIKVKDATKTTVKIDGEIYLNNADVTDWKTFTYSEEGTHTLVAIDAVGNTETITFTIDTQAPKIEGLGTPISTDIQNGVVVKKYFDELKTLTFSDATGMTVTVNDEKVTLRDGKTYAFTKDGLYHVVVTDEAGHTSKETFVIDRQAPNIGGVVEGTHYNEDTKPSITVSDLTLDSVTLNGTIIHPEDYNNLSLVEGTNKIKATDRTGHSKEITFVYDTKAPIISIVDGDKIYTENTTIRVEANKNGIYSIPNATAEDAIDGTVEVTKTGSVSLATTGSQTIKYTAVDKANNKREITLTVIVQDTDAPNNLDYRILNEKDKVGNWFTKPIQVQLSAEDAGTGVTKYEYRILSNGSAVTEWITLSDFANPTFTMPENINGKNISFEFKAYDENKASEVKQSSEYQVDTKAPTVTPTINVKPNDKGWYKDTIDVLLVGKDDTSSVTHFLYQISLGNDIWTHETRLEATNGTATLQLDDKYESSTIYYRVIAVDEAGYRSVVATNEIALKLDKTAPTISVIDGKNTYTEDTTIEVEANKNGTYSIPEAKVEDKLDKTVTVSHTGTVSLTSLTKQTITYTATDEAGNTATIHLIVSVDDTKAPVITVNKDKDGNTNISVLYGSKYEDLGATAEDNLDETVTVKTDYNIDTYQAGKTYTVTYTATDKKGNTSKATRTVKIASATTAEVIKDENDCTEGTDCYIKTVRDDKNQDVTANYVWYSGHLWRIIKVNADNTVKLVTQESVSGFAYGDGTSSTFKGSYAEDWLNGTFYNSLQNAPHIIVESDYCNARITATTNARKTCASKYVVSDRVALLTMDEYNILGGARSFLYTGDAFYTMSASSTKELVVIVENGTVDFGYKSHEPYAMRPVITISSDIEIVSGKGTLAEPFYIEKNETAQPQTLLNERYSGEYVKFGKNGTVWRIMNTDGTSTRLISDTFYKNGTDYAKVEFGTTNSFNTTSGVGQYLNTTVYNDLFSETDKQKMLLTKWYYNGHKLGDNPKNTTLLASTNYTYAYVGLASVGELMTGQSTTGFVKGLTSWAINPHSTNQAKSWYFTSVGGADYFEFAGHTRGIRPVIELNPNVKITGGNGTANSPYIIQ